MQSLHFREEGHGVERIAVRSGVVNDTMSAMMKLVTSSMNLTSTSPVEKAGYTEKRTPTRAGWSRRHRVACLGDAH